MIVVRNAPPEHFGWIASRAGLNVGAQFRALEAFEESTGEILAMVGYDSWMPNSCSMHVAMDNPAAFKHLVGPAFGVPFTELGLGLVTGFVISTNEKAISFDKRLGFRETHRIADGYSKGVDIVILEMRSEECRWIKQAEQEEAA